MSKILLVEDEAVIFEPLQERLVADGFGVEIAPTVREATQILGGGPDLVLLDWNLPDGAGIDLLGVIRQQVAAVPVIFLTARADLVDRVLGLEMGADDYLIKPFEYRELLARIRVQLRGKNSEIREDTPTPKSSDAIRVDSGSYRAFFYEKEVGLTPMEFKLLKFFLEHPGQVFARDELLDRVWGFDSWPTTRTVDTHVLQLRQKFDSSAFETVRKIGYRYCPENLPKTHRQLTVP